MSRGRVVTRRSRKLLFCSREATTDAVRSRRSTYRSWGILTRLFFCPGRKHDPLGTRSTSPAEGAPPPSCLERSAQKLAESRGRAGGHAAAPSPCRKRPAEEAHAEQDPAERSLEVAEREPQEKRRPEEAERGSQGEAPLGRPGGGPIEEALERWPYRGGSCFAAKLQHNVKGPLRHRRAAELRGS